MANNVRFTFNVGDSPRAVYTCHCARQIESVSLNTISSVVKRVFTEIQVNMLTWRGIIHRAVFCILIVWVQLVGDKGLSIGCCHSPRGLSSTSTCIILWISTTEAVSNNHCLSFNLFESMIKVEAQRKIQTSSTTPGTRLICIWASTLLWSSKSPRPYWIQHAKKTCGSPQVPGSKQHEGSLFMHSDLSEKQRKHRISTRWHGLLYILRQQPVLPHGFISTSISLPCQRDQEKTNDRQGFQVVNCLITWLKCKLVLVQETPF